MTKIFSSTVLIALTFNGSTGIQNSYIPWQDWLKFSKTEKDSKIEQVVRKYHLAKPISYTYKVSSIVPNEILCAAIWYLPETLSIEKPLNIDFGTVYTGRRHSNCFELLLLQHKDIKATDYIEGFITKNNVFLDRSQAYEAAKAFNQVAAGSPLLVSEMLYSDV